MCSSHLAWQMPLCVTHALPMDPLIELSYRNYRTYVAKLGSVLCIRRPELMGTLAARTLMLTTSLLCTAWQPELVLCSLQYGTQHKEACP